MKIAFTSFAVPKASLAEVIDAALTHGYQGVEFRCDARQAHGVEAWSSPDERKQMRRQLEGSGIHPCCLASSLQFVHRSSIEPARRRIELARDLGCPGIRVFCGMVPEGMVLRDALERAAEHLHDVVIEAADAGVGLWLETHDAVSRSPEAATVLRMVDHANLGILYDNLHPSRMGEPVIETFAALGPHIRHTHIHNGLSRPDVVLVTPLDRGEVPVDDAFKALVDLGYQGYISGEWFHNQYGDDPGEALEAYHRDIRTLCERHGVRL